MPISKISFEDRFRRWKLKEVAFSDFNLLVGQSGAGKTQILRAIRSVCSAATENTEEVNGCTWELELSIDKAQYRWAASTSLAKTAIQSTEGVSATNAERVRFTEEYLVRNNQQVLVKRDKAGFIFDDKTLPKLKVTESAITLLREEPLIAPVYQMLSQLVFSGDLATPDYIADTIPFLSLGKIYGPLPFALAKDNVESVRQCKSLEDLRQITEQPLLLRAYALQEDYSKEFYNLKEIYREIFPTVIDIRIDSLNELAPHLVARYPHLRDSYSIGIKEKVVEGWIIGQQISAGMMRTLVHLLEISLSPPGTVLIIDEVENSLGNNCLPYLIDQFLRRSDLQFILTSHHPYIINNIPWRYWKLVTRKGSEVTVIDADSVQAIDEASSLEKFTQLMKFQAEEEMIQ